MDLFGGESLKTNISAYSDSFFVIGEEQVKGSLLLFSEGYFSLHASTADELTPDVLQVLSFKRPQPRTLDACNSTEALSALTAIF